ncbi:MAG: TetR family transcriptional regulator [Alphaproteobacteria bacterium]|nr:TetR family transcriptional regulator [Alphaproteobacteria bacterium]
MLTAIRPTREKLLRAALTLVARSGFEAATTAAIAEAAGVAEGTLYRHFASKDDLLIEVYRNLKSEVLTAVEDGEDRAASPEARLKRWWLALFEAYRSDIEAFTFGQRFMESPLAQREGGAAKQRFIAPLAAIREEGVRAGVFCDLPQDLMASLFIAPISYLLKQETQGRRWSAAELEGAADGVVRSWRAG